MHMRIEPEAQGHDGGEAGTAEEDVSHAKERERQRTEKYRVQHVRGRHGRHESRDGMTNQNPWEASQFVLFRRVVEILVEPKEAHVLPGIEKAFRREEPIR